MKIAAGNGPPLASSPSFPAAKNLHLENFSDVTVTFSGPRPSCRHRNPLGNVAMWINQLDYFALTNDNFPNRSSEAQINYIPLKLNKING